ncbi:MAG: hypothetical protein ACFFFT_19345 [Candidatus Thorarchaeota archaeon]
MDLKQNDIEKKEIVKLARKGLNAYYAGKLERALKKSKQGLKLVENFQGDLPKELQYAHCMLLYAIGLATIEKGYLTRGFRHANELLTIAEKYGFNLYIAWAFSLIGEYYFIIGDLDEAFMYFERVTTLLEESNIKSNSIFNWSLIVRTYIHERSIRIAIDKGDLELARNHLERLEEIYEQDNIFMTCIYKVAKADILRTGKRSRDKTKAEELYKEVIEGKLGYSIYKFDAFIKLCELLLDELKLTGQIAVIDEIKPLLEETIDLAQKSKSDLHLTNAYVMQGKVALLTFDIKTARRVLIQAQRIAERRGFKTRAEEIARLHEDLAGKLDMWEHLKETNAPLSERIELARINEHLDGQFRKKIMKMERVAEEEVTVYKDSKTCVVCKGSAGGFNIYVCPTCNSIYCRKCAQAVVEIENICWTCESLIDKSKPSKPFEKEDQEKQVKEDASKKALDDKSKAADFMKKLGKF